MNARARSARLLAPVLSGKQAFDLPEGLDDGPLCAELCYGTLRFLPRLQRELQHLLSKPLRAKDADVEALLLIGLYQLEQTRIPDHAAVAESVAAARQLGKSWAAGLVNAVLRGRLRQAEQLDRQLSGYADYRWAHPDWLIERIRNAWPDQAEQIFQANNLRPPMTLRVNLARVDRAAYLQQLLQKDIQAAVGRWSPAAILLEQACPVAALPGFAEGLVSVQDEAAQLCAALLDAQPENRVLDACAAPGGKTCHILEIESNCRLDAYDIDSDRLLKVSGNLARLGLKAELHCADAGDPDIWAEQSLYQRILLDAPCSGTGVIRRHPDIKALRRPSDIAQFVNQQQRLLETLWSQLQPHGLLLYVTCSIMPEENHQLVESFISQHPEAEAQPIAAEWGVISGPGRQLLPEPEGTDGFYFALLKKTTGKA